MRVPRFFLSRENFLSLLWRKITLSAALASSVSFF